MPPVRVPFNDNKAFKPNHPPKKSLERFCGIQKVAEGRRGLGWAAGAELNTEIRQGYSTNLGLIRQESFFFLMGFALFFIFFSLKASKVQTFGRARE